MGWMHDHFVVLEVGRMKPRKGTSAPTRSAPLTQGKRVHAASQDHGPLARGAREGISATSFASARAFL